MVLLKAFEIQSVSFAKSTVLKLNRKSSEHTENYEHRKLIHPLSVHTMLLDWYLLKNALEINEL